MSATCGLWAFVVNPQESTANKKTTVRQERRAVVVPSDGKKTYPAATGNNLYCAGYLQTAPFETKMEVVGGEQEQEQNIYSNNNYIYVSAGANQDVKTGDRFSVIRPRGKMTSPFSKKGDLGKYVQELGVVRIVNVKEQVAVGVIENSCEAILLGDLIVPLREKFSPLQREEPAFDRFKDANGKQTERIVLARDGQEMLAPNQIVYLDLGVDNGVKVGDYLTVYRPLGKGGVNGDLGREIVSDKDYGFESEVFRGGKYSNEAPRRGKPNYDGSPIVTSKEAKSRRPKDLRKIVGEVVILNVKEKTATAIITRVAQEVHTGDFVELQ